MDCLIHIRFVMELLKKMRNIPVENIELKKCFKKYLYEVYVCYFYKLDNRLMLATIFVWYDILLYG